MRKSSVIQLFMQPLSLYGLIIPQIIFMNNCSRSRLALMTFVLVILFTACSNRTENSIIKSKVALEKHEITSLGHPITVWKKSPQNPIGAILFVHGRTWSGLPDFDLQVEGEELSLMDGMVEQGFSTYAIDLRGYGDTPRDSSEWNTPMKAAQDILSVTSWIAQEERSKVHLFGWSMGSTLSLLATQLDPKDLLSLTLFGFWKDMDLEIPKDTAGYPLQKIVNTAKAAASDFIVPGSISDKAVETYVKMSLESDPIKVDWQNQSEYNALDPSLIEVPVLIMQGEFDPIGPTEIQAKLFTRLKTANKSWSVIAGGDHAAHLENSRDLFIEVLTNFITRFN